MKPLGEAAEEAGTAERQVRGTRNRLCEREIDGSIGTYGELLIFRFLLLSELSFERFVVHGATAALAAAALWEW